MLKMCLRHTLKSEKKINAMIDNLEGQFQSIIDAQSKNNPKMFWLHVHSKLKAKSWHGTSSTEQNG